MMAKEESMDEFLSSEEEGLGAAASEKRSSKAMDAQQGQKSMEKRAKSPMNSAGVKPHTQRMGLLKAHGKRRIQICFRITENAWERLTLISRLFEMTESDYTKAVLYKDLGIWTERLDYRRKKRP